MKSEGIKISLFYCSNSLDKEQISKFNRVMEESINISDIKIISLPCSGKLNVPYIVKAFETGADGILIITCRQGQCQNIEGNKRAIKRAEAIDSLNEEIGLGKGRVSVIQAPEGRDDNVAEQIKEFCVSLNKIKEEFVTTRGPQ
jgi:F420-non-reducing hydrogenase iron-sulfur subunit